jgi:O-antigen/teichoic acid export membrane protein
MVLTTGGGQGRIAVLDQVTIRHRTSPRALLNRVRDDSLLRNSVFIMATTIVNSGFGFFFWLVAARLFNAQAVGLTAALTSAATLVTLLSTQGVGGTLVHSLAGRTNTPVWSVTFWTGMATALMGAATLGAVAIFVLPRVGFDVLNSTTYSVAFGLGTITMTAGTVLDYVFVSERAAGNMLARNAFVSAAKLLAVVLVTVVAGAGARDLLGAWASAYVVGLGCAGILLRRRVQVRRPPRPSVMLATAKRLRTLLAGHQLIGIGAAVLPYILPLVVTARLSTSANAYFYTTWMTSGIFLIISPALSQALFAEGAHRPEDLAVQARSALASIGAILLPCIVGVFILGGVLLSAFGPNYQAHATGLLRIVLIASIPDAITNVYVAVLRVQGRLAVAATLNLGMGIGIVAGTWALLPGLGIVAAGWAFLAMQIVGCVFVLVDVLRRRGITVGELERVVA